MMKKLITLLSAFAGMIAPIAFAEERLIELPPQIIHYGTLAPVPVSQAVPDMPSSIQGIDGFVLLQFDISEKGRVSNIVVVEQTDKRMAKYSLGMVRKWRYENRDTGITALQPIIFEGTKKSPTLLASK
jgi:hypothetical protein